jgi:hypothetical protein
MASTDPRILNDQKLVDYSYRNDPSIGPPTLSNGVELTKLGSFSENGADVPIWALVDDLVAKRIDANDKRLTGIPVTVHLIHVFKRAQPG